MEIYPPDRWLVLTLHQYDGGTPIFSLDLGQTFDHLFDILFKQCLVALVNHYFEKLFDFLFSISHYSTLLKILCGVTTDSECQFISSWLLLFFLLFLSFLRWDEWVLWLSRQFDVHNCDWRLFVIQKILYNYVIVFFAKIFRCELFLLEIRLEKLDFRFIGPFVNLLAW